MKRRLRLAMGVSALAAALVVAAAAATSADSNTGCSAPPPTKPGHGYRDGRCGGCECCPLRWSCLEMHSRGYSCAGRTGVPVEELQLGMGLSSVAVGETVTASVPGVRWNAVPECHSVLPPGLSLHLNSSDSDATPSALELRGVLGYDPARDATYTLDFEAVSVVGDSAEKYSLQRVTGKLTVRNVRRAGDSKSEAALEAQVAALTASDAKARGAGLAGFRAFEQYYTERTLSHRDSVRRMYAAEQELCAVLDESPAVASGLYWNWAGGLYMNLHKLLEDVLVDGCEHHFEQGLLYKPEDENLRANLDGCLVHSAHCVLSVHPSCMQQDLLTLRVDV